MSRVQTIDVSRIKDIPTSKDNLPSIRSSFTLPFSLVMGDERG